MSRRTSIRAAQAVIGGEVVGAVVVVEDGVIAEILDKTAHPAVDEALKLPIDTVLLPGVVDTHVHVNEPGRTDWEGFASATEAAARGGVTTVVDMPLNSVPSTVDVAALDLKRSVAADQAYVDVGFWGGAVPGNDADLEPLWEAGVFGFKCFLLDSGVPEFAPLDPAQFRRAMRTIGRFGGLMIVHAEDAGTIERATAGSSRAYPDFVLSRPDAAEVTAIGQVLDGVRETGTRAHVLHLSSARALDLLADARAEGLPVTVETCPHYLVFAADSVPDGSPQYKCCPPIRDRGNQDALWQGLADGVIDCVVSDHSPSTLAQKQAGDGDLQQAWGGIAGLQVGLVVVADAARSRGYSPADVTRWMSTAPADLVGLGDRGRLEVGARADLVLYDGGLEQTVDQTALAHKVPLSAYDGRVLSGTVTGALLAGRPVWKAEGLGPPAGRLLRRA